LPEWILITKPRKIAYMISIASKGICGEDDVRVLGEKEAIISGVGGWDSLG
jgi:hypothetical protein